jgi:hypothetical protein
MIGYAFRQIKKGTGCPIKNFGHDIYLVVIPAVIDLCVSNGKWHSICPLTLILSPWGED